MIHMFLRVHHSREECAHVFGGDEEEGQEGSVREVGREEGI